MYARLRTVISPYFPKIIPSFPKISPSFQKNQPLVSKKSALSFEKHPYNVNGMIASIGCMIGVAGVAQLLAGGPSRAQP